MQGNHWHQLMSGTNDSWKHQNMNAGASPPTSGGKPGLNTLNHVKQSRLLARPLEEWSPQEVQQASAVLNFLWTLQLRPSSLDSRQRCVFSYLLPLELSVSPCTWPRLVVVMMMVVGRCRQQGAAELGRRDTRTALVTPR